MKRTLLLASFLGLLGCTLYAQNSGKESAGQSAVNNSDTPPRTRSPGAQVRVSPGPQGLPIVNSSASAWPLGPALEEDLDYWLNGTPRTPGNGGEPPGPALQDSRPRTSESKPVFEPPPMGALPSLGAPRPGGRAPASMGPDAPAPDSLPPRDFQDKLPAKEIPVEETSRAPALNGAGGEAPGQPAIPPQDGRLGPRLSQGPSQTRAAPPSSPAKEVVVVPSPVHYDRAGRRVIDPGWQETVYRMIQAEQETPAETEKAAERAGETGSQNGAQDAPPVRETFIVVPGPTVWRIRGVLTAARGMLALEDHDGVLWYLPGLDRYIGFIDGLDAGEEAALEGYAPPGGSSQERYFQPIRLFIDDMAYDLTIPPYGIGIPGSGGRQTMRIESWAAPGSGTGLGDDPRYQSDPWDEGDRDGETPVEERRRTRRERGREPGPPPAWNHPHKSPWAPPPTVLEFEMDYDSFWREDEAKQRRRERDSREIWY